MFYVGLDVHVKSIVMCVLDSQGRVVQRRTCRQLSELLEVLGTLPRPWRVVYEASTGYGRLYELLSPLADQVQVAHAGQLRLIFRSKSKNDRNDAEKLAKLLYLGEVPAVHVPAAEVRAWREMITFRRRLVEKRTRAKNGVRPLLRTLGLKPPRGLWTIAGRAWLTALTFAQPFHAVKRDLLLDELKALGQQLRRVEAELDRIGQVHPSVIQLQSIPGVGPRTAEAIVAFLDDPQRFRHSKQVGSYFGLVPRQDQSGGRDHKGRITREGPATVRQLLVEAVWQSVRHSPTVKAYFERLQRNDPDRKKIAIVATAHYLARVMWAMLKHGTLWKEQPTALAV